MPFRQSVHSPGPQFPSKKTIKNDKKKIILLNHLLKLSTFWDGGNAVAANQVWLLSIGNIISVTENLKL